ncbi:Baeyer-Villiger monooxygenase [Fusarium oxysporum]|uniref:L-ornithine N(5)-monooxygenase [NAD(P)H] n=1 Tax=Fusarium oxysporum TaxID=5507 RepID=A0A420Q7N8_FUSOX|nr:Baeyer-Villiger monooxygenase [Fusarium oxysporum]
MGEQIPVHKKFNTELTDYSVEHHGDQGVYADNLEVDALVVGAGFAGIFMLKTLRDRGYKTVVYEAGNDTGVIGVKKDIAFNTVVVGGKFDTESGRWHIRTADGRVAKAKYLVLGTGFAARRYIPDWPGMDKFKGIIHHSSFWPDEKVDVTNKRCAIIGTGASGVQITQAWGPEAGHLKVFQRTPNLAVPMRRKYPSAEEQNQSKKFYPELFRYREENFAGFHYDWYEKNTFDDTPEDREALYEQVWKDGGFRYWVAVYKDNLFNAEANKESYKFWAKKTRNRIGDPKKRDLLAPTVDNMPHYFGIKRPCLEYDYYEQFNRENVDVVDIKNNAIKEFTETGITLEDGTHHEFDVIAVATGFDVVTGGEYGFPRETYLGVTTPGYPNMFHIYGPHGPTLLSNGLQGRWIVDCIDKIKNNNIKYINPEKKAGEEWKKHIVELNNRTLFPTTRSTYMGGSIPGKIYEPVCYSGGIPAYKIEIREALDTMKGFEIVKNK